MEKDFSLLAHYTDLFNRSIDQMVFTFTEIKKSPTSDIEGNMRKLDVVATRVIPAMKRSMIFLRNTKNGVK